MEAEKALAADSLRPLLGAAMEELEIQKKQAGTCWTLVSTGCAILRIH
jgi:hypothetical protein